MAGHAYCLNYPQMERGTSQTRRSDLADGIATLLALRVAAPLAANKKEMPKIFGRMSAPPLSAVLLFLCLPSVAADEAVFIERLYTGGSCSGSPAFEVTFPSGRCAPMNDMGYRNAWWEWPSDGTSGSDAIYSYSSVFVVGTEIQYCWGTTQASCDNATRGVINSGIWSSPALVYPDTATATCGPYMNVTYATGACVPAANMDPTCSTMADCGCTLSGCRLSLTMATAPSPPSPVFITESLYSTACSGQPAASHTNAIGECEPMNPAYMAAWGDPNNPDGTGAWYSASGAPYAYVGNSRVAPDTGVWCWATTKHACESAIFAYGSVSAPFATNYYGSYSYDAAPNATSGSYSYNAAPNATAQYLDWVNLYPSGYGSDGSLSTSTQDCGDYAPQGIDHCFADVRGAARSRRAT